MRNCLCHPPPGIMGKETHWDLVMSNYHFCDLTTEHIGLNCSWVQILFLNTVCPTQTRQRIYSAFLIVQFQSLIPLSPLLHRFMIYSTTLVQQLHNEVHFNLTERS